jgi:hypothetical protein
MSVEKMTEGIIKRPLKKSGFLIKPTMPPELTRSATSSENNIKAILKFLSGSTINMPNKLAAV